MRYGVVDRFINNARIQSDCICGIHALQGIAEKHEHIRVLLDWRWRGAAHRGGARVEAKP